MIWCQYKKGNLFFIMKNRKWTKFEIWFHDLSQWQKNIVYILTVLIYWIILFLLINNIIIIPTV